MKRGKKYQNNLKQIDREHLYEVEEAIELVKKLSNANFDETIEAHIRLGVDSRHGSTGAKSYSTSPRDREGSKGISLCKGRKVSEAESAGADYVGGEEYTEKFKRKIGLTLML